MSTVTAESFAFLYADATAPPPARAEQSVLVSTDSDGVTTVEMNAPPVNLFTPDYLGYVNDWLRYLHHDPSTRGIVLTSAVPNQFCAGGDLNECMAPNMEKTRRFWGQVQAAWLVLNAHRKPVVSVITGTCPGGGCVLSMACDFRVMVRAAASRSPARARPFKIGLNAPAFGICMPVLISQMYRELLGLRRAELMLQRGCMLTADEAAQAGLVDVAVDTKEAGVHAAKAYLREVLVTPVETRFQQKMQLRLPFIAPLATPEGREAEIEAFFRAVDNESTQKVLGAYIAGLHERKHRETSPHF